MQGKITFEPTKNKEPLYKVVGKYKDKNNKLMLQLHDGSVMAAKSDISINDSVILKGGKIEKTLKLAPGALCAVVNGVHVGSQRNGRQPRGGHAHKPRSLVIESGSSKFETLVRNIMVTG